LLPLREQLDGFRRQVQDSFGQEAPRVKSVMTLIPVAWCAVLKRRCKSGRKWA